jgi:hypothetical protein
MVAAPVVALVVMTPVVPVVAAATRARVWFAGAGSSDTGTLCGGAVDGDPAERQQHADEQRRNHARCERATARRAHSTLDP